MLIYLNGRYIDRAEATISIEDRGFLFGDGVYEVTRAIGGRLFEPERHLRRLQRGLRELRIDFSEADSESVVGISNRLLHENGLDSGEATVYVEITRGAAPRTHHFPPVGTAPTVLVRANPFKPKAALCESGADAVTWPDIRWARCDLKTINLLPNVLAQETAVAAGAEHAIFVRDGVVTEGSHTNVFAVIDGELRTHPHGPRILPGITRDVVIELAAEQELPVREEAFTLDELAEASELFVTSTTTDLMPIIRLDGRPIGGGAPGPIARRLYEALLERMGGVPV